MYSNTHAVIELTNKLCFFIYAQEKLNWRAYFELREIIILYNRAKNVYDQPLLVVRTIEGRKRKEISI